MKPSCTPIIFRSSTGSHRQEMSRPHYSSGETLVVVLSPLRSDMQDWWAAQPSSILTVTRLLGPEDCPSNTNGAILSLRGRRLGEIQWTEANNEELKRLFRALLGAVDQALPLRIYPDFSPALSWLGTTRIHSARCCR